MMQPKLEVTAATRLLKCVMAAVSSSEVNGSAPVPRWRRIVFHPLWALPIFLFVTQKARESAYPLSHFAMYSNPSDWDDYIYLTDAQNQPLAVQHATGVSVAKLGKVFNNSLKAHGLRQSAQKRDAPRDIEAAVGLEVLAKARRWSENRRRPLPQPTRLYRVIVERTGDGGLSERTHLVAEG
jgi:hypothetical protein